MPSSYLMGGRVAFFPLLTPFQGRYSTITLSLHKNHPARLFTPRHLALD